MIQVTMSFASREEMLAFFATPVGESSPEARPPVQSPVKATRAPKPEAAATPPTAPQAAAPEQKAETSAPATPTSAPAEAPAAAPTIPYEKVGTAIQNLVAKDRSKAVAVLASMGVKKGTELKPEQYAEALAKFEAAMAEADQALA